MVLTGWMKSFEIGNAEIDQQHQNLLDNINETAVLLDAGHGKQAFASCQKIQSLLKCHLEEEEEILRGANFSRLDDHLKSHADASAQFNGIISSCKEVCKCNKPSSCMLSMSGILVDHFLHGDLDFKSFLETKDLAERTRGH